MECSGKIERAEREEGSHVTFGIGGERRTEEKETGISENERRRIDGWQ